MIFIQLVRRLQRPMKSSNEFYITLSAGRSISLILQISIMVKYWNTFHSTISQQIPLGANRTSDLTSEWAVAFWGPHVSAAWILLRSTSGEREIEMHKIESTENWGVVLSGLPSIEDLEKGQIKYHFILESSWNNCFELEGAKLHRRMKPLIIFLFDQLFTTVALGY